MRACAAPQLGALTPAARAASRALRSCSTRSTRPPRPLRRRASTRSCALLRRSTCSAQEGLSLSRARRRGAWHLPFRWLQWHVCWFNAAPSAAPAAMNQSAGSSLMCSRTQRLGWRERGAVPPHATRAVV
jgi:hypothetical protein